ncbi:hypothetical protein SDC9_125723 [bioreactor metagenome]|uniref:Uncharacterized protein n=1 Tax=bioreactor metagenome TaxID=1076179 RepID=A0A645CPQ1_9ZZZZ
MEGQGGQQRQAPRKTACTPLLQQHAADHATRRHREIEHGHQHGLRHVGVLCGGIGKGSLQQRGRATKGHSPQRHADQHRRGRRSGKSQQQGGQGEACQAQQRQGAQQFVHEQAGEPDAHHGRHTEQHQHRVHAPAQADQLKVGRDVGIENVVRQNPGQQSKQDRAYAGHDGDVAYAFACMRGLPRIVRHGGAHPHEQKHRQRRHDPEHAAPVEQGAQPGAQRHADRQRNGLAHAGNGQCTALLRRRHHAPHIACQQSPDDARGHAGHEAREQRECVAGRHGGCRIEHHQAGNGEQQQRAPGPTAGIGNHGDGRQHGAQRVQRDQLSGHGGADLHALADLWQQACGHGLGHDGQKTGHRERQQLSDRQLQVRSLAGGLVMVGVVVGGHGCSCLARSGQKRGRHVLVAMTTR